MYKKTAVRFKLLTILVLCILLIHCESAEVRVSSLPVPVHDKETKKYNIDRVMATINKYGGLAIKYEGTTGVPAELVMGAYILFSNNCETAACLENNNPFNMVGDATNHNHSYPYVDHPMYMSFKTTAHAFRFYFSYLREINAGIISNDYRVWVYNMYNTGYLNYEMTGGIHYIISLYKLEEKLEYLKNNEDE